MSELWGFRDERTATKLKELVKDRASGNVAAAPAIRQGEGLIARTPSQGIPARDPDDTCHSEECDLYYIAADDKLTPFKDPGGANHKRKIWNIFSEPIGGQVFITCKIVGGKAIADAEDC